MLSSRASSPLFSQLAASAGAGSAPYPQTNLLAQLRARLAGQQPHPMFGQPDPQPEPQTAGTSLLAQAAGTKRGPRVIGPGGPFGGRASY